MPDIILVSVPTDASNKDVRLIDPVGSSVSITLSPALDALAIAELTPTVSAGAGLSPTPAALAIAELTPTVSAGAGSSSAQVFPGVEAIIIVGSSVDVTIVAGADLVLTGLRVAVLADDARTAKPSAGIRVVELIPYIRSIALTGFAPRDLDLQVQSSRRAILLAA